ncbi:MAG TPA: hypothetical protein VEC36_04605 [Patescibacteria group bacterium]|nr:hypothetical protein [Patescibacteria group bacterium]
MIYWEDSFARVTFERDVPAVMIQWLSYATSQQFRTAIKKELEAYEHFLREHKKLHWIAETTRMIGVGHEDIEWVASELNPRMYKAGLRYMAVVLPQSAFAKMSVDDYVQFTDQKQIEIRNFGNLSDAKSWLKTK